MAQVICLQSIRAVWSLHSRKFSSTPFWNLTWKKRSTFNCTFVVTFYRNGSIEVYFVLIFVQIDSPPTNSNTSAAELLQADVFLVLQVNLIEADPTIMIDTLIINRK